MTRYSVRSRENISKKLRILSFAKYGQKYKQKISSKYCQKRLDYAKQSATDAFKTSSERVIQETEEITAGDLIGNKIADKVTRVSKASLKNNLETNEEILGEKYTSLELRQKRY